MSTFVNKFRFLIQGIFINKKFRYSEIYSKIKKFIKIIHSFSVMHNGQIIELGFSLLMLLSI